MDKIDRKILYLLQRNGALTADELGARVGLSKAPCWRRVQRLKESGAIAKTVALLDPAALNLRTTVFVMIKTATHAPNWMEKFSKALQQLPEVIEVHRLSGDVDYLIRIVVPDIGAYDAVYKKMIAAVDMADVTASFVLESIKNTTVLPLDYL
ncbi:MAG TPA: Lrp/AsnC family transcriptional regulator [Steroidobacteraceae bacterium]|nr:Lrp/AsnC family transcriptional regulator [Steroidobacteraceae bacterium]